MDHVIAGRPEEMSIMKLVNAICHAVRRITQVLVTFKIGKYNMDDSQMKILERHWLEFHLVKYNKSYMYTHCTVPVCIGK